MSFTWFADKPLRTREQVAREVHAVSLARGLDELATVMALMCISVESDFWCPGNDKDPCFHANPNAYPHDSLSSDGYSSGYYQQQMSGPGVTPAWGWGGHWGDPDGTRKRMDLRASTDLFLAALPDDYGRANTAASAGEVVANVQKPDPKYRYRYAEKWDEAWALLRRALGGQIPTTPEVPVPDNRPAYNEFPIWSENHYDGRSGVTVDMFNLHTSEGFVGRDDAAEALSLWYQPKSRQVAYHYAVSQASDGGVTVVDNVDTDDAAWSVLSANNRSINLCFAGTQAAWSRNDWLTKFGNAIDVAAYLAVQDCKKYGIPTKVIAPPYTGRIPGITDHRYVTKVLGDGTHTDVGDGFPWDVFAAAVQKYATGGDTPAPAGPTPIPREDADLQLVTRFKCLGERTLVEAVGAIGAKLGIEGCYDTKAGA